MGGRVRHGGFSEVTTQEVIDSSEMISSDSRFDAPLKEYSNRSGAGDLEVGLGRVDKKNIKLLVTPVQYHGMFTQTYRPNLRVVVRGWGPAYVRFTTPGREDFSSYGMEP